jgi:predicted SAM-dependent methyltransferase
MNIDRAAKTLIRKIANAAGYEIRKVQPSNRANPPIVDLESMGITERKVHYACGGNLRAGWLNVDQYASAPPPHTYLRVDLIARHPFYDDMFEFGYAEDFVEHLSQADSITFLSEAYRTLKPGGVLRLSFPGLEGVLKKHYQGRTYPEVIMAKADAYTKWDHRHFYSREELVLLCSNIGYRHVAFSEYGVSRHDALRGMDSRELQKDLNTFAELTK